MVRRVPIAENKFLTKEELKFIRKKFVERICILFSYILLILDKREISL